MESTPPETAARMVSACRSRQRDWISPSRRWRNSLTRPCYPFGRAGQAGRREAPLRAGLLSVFQPVEALREIRCLQVVELPDAGVVKHVGGDGLPAIAGNEIGRAQQNITDARRTGQAERHTAV